MQDLLYQLETTQNQLDRLQLDHSREVSYNRDNQMRESSLNEQILQVKNIMVGLIYTQVKPQFIHLVSFRIEIPSLPFLLMAITSYSRKSYCPRAKEAVKRLQISFLTRFTRLQPPISTISTRPRLLYDSMPMLNPCLRHLRGPRLLNVHCCLRNSFEDSTARSCFLTSLTSERDLMPPRKN